MRAGLTGRRLAWIMSAGSAMRVHFGARTLHDVRVLLVRRD
jgi:hypothetical protein